MTGKRLLVLSVFLLTLPVIVAWFGVSVAGAVALVIVALAYCTAAIHFRARSSIASQFPAAISAATNRGAT